MADRGKGFGLTAELNEKAALKYDMQLAREATEWIDDVLGENNLAGAASADQVHEKLKDGVILCNLVNKIKPGSVKKINTTKMAFKQMENVGNFLDSCAKIGVQKGDLFQTVDLYEKKNMAQVITAIHALGRKAPSVGFSGPTLGPKEATANRREFTEEQLRGGSGHIGLQMGSNKGASQSGQSFGATRQIAR